MTGRPRAPHGQGSDNGIDRGGVSRSPRSGDSVAAQQETAAEVAQAGRASSAGGTAGTPQADRLSSEPRRQRLLDELRDNGVRHNPQDIVAIGRNGAGDVIFLENGNSRAGLLHITERHAGDFANVGVPENKVGALVFTAVTQGTEVGAQRTRPIYEVEFEGRTYRLAVSVGSNGFIVGANPVGH